jgi:hypothetical protein
MQHQVSPKTQQQQRSMNVTTQKHNKRRCKDNEQNQTKKGKKKK